MPKEKLAVSTSAVGAKRGSAALLALITSVLVALSGLFVAPAAQAAPIANATVSVAGADANGLTVQVNFSDVPPSPLAPPQNMGVYAALVETGSTAYLGAGTWVRPDQIANGAGTAMVVTKVADGLDRNKSYELLMWYAHGNPTEDAIVLRQAVTITSEQWDAVFPPAPQPTATATTLSAAPASATVGAPVVLTTQVAPAAPGTVTFSEGGTVLGSAPTDGAGAAALSLSTLNEGAHNIVADFAPTDASAFAASTSAAASVTITAPVTPVEVSVTVKSVSETGLTVSASVTGVNPASQPNGVHVGVVLRGTANGAQAADFLGATASVKPIPESGAFSADVVIPANKLDPFQQYELVVWPQRSNPITANVVKVVPFDVTLAQWGQMFPDRGIEGKASVKSATETGLTIAGAVTGVDAASYSLGVHVGVVLRGTANGARQADFLGATASIRPIPASGTVSAEVAIPAAKLDRSQQYELVVWPQRSNPTTANIVKVIPFDVSTAQWDTVFGVEAPKISASVLDASETGLKVSATVENIILRAAADVPDTGKDDQGVYVGIIEKDRVADYQTNASAGAKEDFAYKTFIKDGRVTRSIDVPAAKLDRAKQYVAVSWLAHGFLSDSRFLAQTDLAISETQWDAVFGPEPKISASVTDAGKDGLKVSATVENIVLRAAADVPDTGKDDQGVYVGIIEKDRVAEYRVNASAGAKEDFAYKTFIKDGKVTRSIDVPAAKLDRTKEYVVVSWLAHGFLNDDRFLAQTDLAITKGQWDAVFGPTDPTGQSSATVTSLSSGQLGVRADLIGLDPADLPNGVYVGLLKRGTAETAQMEDVYGVQWVTSIPSDGKLSQSLKPIANTDLDRKAQYDVLVWKAHTFPGAANNLQVLPLTLTASQWDELFGTVPAPTTPGPTPQPVGGSMQAGSLTWGISSGFRGYTTGPIAKGAITTSGVGSGGGAYLFPQATAGSWDKNSQTGSVQYSGVVTFSGHNGLMTETFANPVITVTSASSGSVSVGGRTFSLNLGAASKSVGANGEVTWSGVPVVGALSGGGSSDGSSGGGSFAMDPLTFTVGAASGVRYGSTTVSTPTKKRTPAATPPATSGIKIVTPADEIVPGGEIEFEASGFERKERDVLVVLYSDPIVLDESAGADEYGTVRWIGTLPEDIEPGEHTITLQGSINAGAVIKVVDEKKEKSAKKATPISKKTSTETAQAAGLAPAEDGAPIWIWWLGALVLLAAAGTTSGLVIAQRRGRGTDG